MNIESNIDMNDNNDNDNNDDNDDITPEDNINNDDITLEDKDNNDDDDDNDDNDDNNDDKKQKRKYRRLRKRLKSLKRNIKFLDEILVNDIWYPGTFFIENGYIPVIKGTLEYDYLLRVVKPHFHYQPKLILKRYKRIRNSLHERSEIETTSNVDSNDSETDDKNLKDEMIEYSFFGEECLPFKLKIESYKIPIVDYQTLPIPEPDLFIFTDNLLKS